MKILICGGSKSGKSAFAERIALRLPSPHYYVATMIATDEEDRDRIRRHKGRRSGLSFQTVEQGRDLTRALEQRDREGTFLIEAMTSLLANEMFGSGSYDPEAGERVREDLETFLREAENVVLVFDSLYLDTTKLDEGSESFRRALAQLQICAAKSCDLCIEICLGEAVVWKGRMEWDALCEEMGGRKDMSSDC
ncbi:MAG: bifunctional adenosylcobinamide kinase/adenosylcobinamide-phosphate guanylyltransferase, partial [Lachnospiraceae bacterium]|nr:bifunctional adenosylcobinamide kinase/adenosylcobinamide-phosphate guanylyltransferase [Lachnospiraceae bacterium]